MKKQREKSKYKTEITLKILLNIDIIRGYKYAKN